MTTKPTQPSFFVARTYAAPRELVWKAWTEATHLARWWGYRGFTNTVHQLEVQPGGSILIHMQSPEGETIPVKGTVHQIAAPERLVFTLTGLEDEHGQPQMEIYYTATFESQGNQTRVGLHGLVTKCTEAVVIYISSMEEGWNQSLENLVAALA